MVKGMEGYVYFLGWMTSSFYVALYFGVLFVRRRMGIVTDEMWHYPKRKFIFIGLMDWLGSTIGLFASSRISGTMITILGQSMAPWTMLMSYTILKIKYTRPQYVGTAIIVSGIAITLVPTFLKLGDREQPDPLGWSLMYLLVTLPHAVAFVYKELVFRDIKIDVFMVNSWSSLFQLFAAFLFLPVVTLDIVPSVDVTLGELPELAGRAWHCFTGNNREFPGEDGLILTDNLRHPDFTCEGNPFSQLFYMAANLSFNISLLFLVKKGGAFFSFIASTISLPLQSLAFAISWPRLEGNPPKIWDILGLLFTLTGLITYRIATMQKANMQKKLAAEGKDTGVLEMENLDDETIEKSKEREA